MDFLRTLKKRRTKKHVVPARVNESDPGVPGVSGVPVSDLPNSTNFARSFEGTRRAEAGPHKCLIYWCRRRDLNPHRVTPTGF